MNVIIRGKMVLTTSLICLIMGNFSGCTNENTALEQDTNHAAIVSGDIYEVTDNNFMKGFEHIFTSEELEILNEVYQSQDFEVGDSYIYADEIRYMINLYDKKKKEVCEFLVDEEGNLYDGEKKGTSIYNEKVNSMIKQIVESNS